MTASWAVAPKMFEFFSNQSSGFINGEVLEIWSNEGMKYNIKNNNIRAGDIMFFAPKLNRHIHHAAIISKVDHNEIYYSAHSGPRDFEKLSNGHLNDEMVFVVRIKDNAIRGYIE